MADKKKRGGDTESFPRLSAILTVVVLLLIAGGLYYYWLSRTPSTVAPQVTTASGSLIAGFPQQFILESGVHPNESSISNYPGGSKFWTASYISQLSPSEILKLYSNYFGFIHWKVTQSTNSAIFAQNNNVQVNVSARNSSSGTEVLLSILQK